MFLVQLWNIMQITTKEKHSLGIVDNCIKIKIDIHQYKKICSVYTMIYNNLIIS